MWRYALLPALWCALTCEATAQNARDPLIGSVHECLLYGFTNYKIEIDGIEEAQLSRIPLLANLPNAPAKNEKIRICFENDHSDRKAFQPLRWRIHSGMFWTCSTGVFRARIDRRKIADLDLDDENNAKSQKQYLERYGRLIPENERGAYFADWQFETIQNRAELMRGLPMLLPLKGMEDYKKINRELAFYDFLPNTPVSGKLLLLEDKKCKIWSVLAEFKLLLNNRQWKLTYSQNPIAVIDLGFTEPFTVFANADAYFFLTRSCKLYSAAKNADGKWKVEKLWSEANRPIHAVITDTATNKSYAFTQAKADKDGKKAKDVYFEFDSKLSPVEFDRSKLKPFQLDPPLDILRSYTQVLIDAKKIDPTPPKKKE